MTITPTSVLLSLASTIPLQGRAQPQPTASAPDTTRPATEPRVKAPQNLPSTAAPGTTPPPVNAPRGTFLDIIV